MECCHCYKQFSKRHSLVQHLKNHARKEKEESLLKFPSLTDFQEWKQKIEEESFSYFNKGRKVIRTQVLYQYYYCHRSGVFVKKGKGIRRMKKQGTCKIGKICPAKIITHLNMKDGSVLVKYHSEHNHERLQHLRIQKTARDSIADISKVHQFKIPKRTEGDGMEKEVDAPIDGPKSLREQLIYRPVDLKECSILPTPITGKVINLVPKSKIQHKNDSASSIKFSREPKFVPYEPYKAATNPIIPEKRHVKKKLVKCSKDAEKVLQMNKLRIADDDTDVKINDSKESDQVNWEQEKRKLQKELNQLKEENRELKDQVKYQAQVNSEVKKLLVAAVGEDIETRVQLLTEDKLILAKQLLNTATTLSTHQEQIEWLAGQCEVWRSKFLSSSILVEDLAKWKAGLCQKVSKYQNGLKQLLEEKDEIRQNEFVTFVNLSTLQEKFNLDVVAEENNQCLEVVSSNAVELSVANHQLSRMLMAQLLHQDGSQQNKFMLDPVDCYTKAEKEAQELLLQPIVSLEQTDVACSAVMAGAALALSSTSPHCSHCNGNVQTI